MWWFQVHTGAWDSNSGAHTCKANASLKTMLCNSFMHLCNRSLPHPCPSAPPLLILLSSPLLLSGCAFVCQAYLEAPAWAEVGGDLPFQRRLMSVSTLTHWAVSPAAMTLRASPDLTLIGRHSLQMEECERVGGSTQRGRGNKQESLVYHLTKQTYNQAYPT